MKRISNVMAAAIVAAGMATVSVTAIAQSAEQYAPIFSYRTGPYAPNGIPVANGTADYLKLVNAKGALTGSNSKLKNVNLPTIQPKGLNATNA